MKIVHIITSLNAGGAEWALYRLLKNLKLQCPQSVICLIGPGVVGDALEALGVEVNYLNMPPGSLRVSGIWKLYRLLRRENNKSVIVQTWLYHSDLLGGVIARICGIRRICWSIRNNRIESNAKATRVVAKLCALISGVVPSKIVCCSSDAANFHRTMGYRKSFRIIPNGYDLTAFDILPAQIDAFRSEIQATDEFILGAAARWDPQKDHKNLLKAVSIWSRTAEFTNFLLVLAGDGCDDKNSELVELIHEFGLHSHIRLLGYRSDVPIVLSALDLHLLSSKSEAFPNVIAEAMMCGVPSVSTDVGDAKEIIGDTGWVVAPNDPDAMARSIALAKERLDSPGYRQMLAEVCRSRISENYSIDSMSSAYQSVWKSL